MTAPLFTGVAVALVTLFDEDGGLDAKATAEHAATLVELGMRAVVVAGSTGEAAALEPEERAALLVEVRRAVPSGIPVLVGTGAPSRRQAAALTSTAVDLGADGVLVLSPPGAADLRRYYQAAATAAGDAAAQLELAASHQGARRSFPDGLKALVADRFGTSRVARLG